MQWPILLTAAVLGGIGVAFVLTGMNRGAAPGLLLAGIICAVAVLLPNGRP